MVKEVEVPKEVYKHDDFFDSLSCEALERLAVSEGAQEKPQVRVWHFYLWRLLKFCVRGSLLLLCLLASCVDTLAWPFSRCLQVCSVRSSCNRELETSWKGRAVVCTGGL